MIGNIQLLRGLAALAVVLVHTEFPLFGGTRTSDFQAVSIFFVISGFIVAYITESGTNNFLTKRIIRVAPLYWLLTVFAFLWLSLDQFSWWRVLFHDWRNAISQIINLKNDTYSIVGILKSLVFVPYKDANSGAYTAFLFVGWTLNIEVFFYLLFSFFSIIGRRVAMGLVSIVLTLLVYLNVTTDDGSVLIRFYGQYVSIYIVTGFAVYWLWIATRSYATRIWSGYFVISAVLLASLFFIVNSEVVKTVVFGWIGSVSPFRALDIQETLVLNKVLHATYYVLPPLIVLIALLLHSSNIRCKWRPMLLLGDISYVLYLSHVIVLNTYIKYFGDYSYLRPKTSVLGFLLVLGLCCIVGWILHTFLEKPLIRWCKSIFERRGWLPSHPSTR